MVTSGLDFPLYSLLAVKISVMIPQVMLFLYYNNLGLVLFIKQLGWMHETSARAWCTGKTQRNPVEREVGGGMGMGNTGNSMADSCQCRTKPTEML